MWHTEIIMAIFVFARSVKTTFGFMQFYLFYWKVPETEFKIHSTVTSITACGWLDRNIAFIISFYNSASTFTNAGINL